MKITTLQVAEYRGAKVYIRNFDNVFEYLVVARGEIYTSHIVINRGFLQRVLFRPFTKHQLDDATRFLLNVAHATIDNLLDGNDAVKK